MNILLVYPKFPETFWGFQYILKFLFKKANLPPLGLLTVAALLPRGWNLRLVDLNVRELDDADLAWANWVMISGMVIQKDSALEIIRRGKAKGKKIIAGGPLFADAEQAPEFAAIDHLILGEAEITWPLFLADFKQIRTRRVYDSDLRPDLRLTPTPRWDLVNLNHYQTIPVQFSRGCPFDCEFCNIKKLNGLIPRTKTPTQFLAELQSLYDAGWRQTVFVVDDNFIGNKSKVKELLRAMINWQKERRYPFKFITEASLNLADDEELMDLMAEANFYKVFLGLETPNQESLAECGKKNNTNKDMAAAVRRIHQHGLQVMGGFIVGFDSDQPDIFRRQFQFIQNAGVVIAMAGLLTAMKGTPLYDRLLKEGRLLEESNGDNADTQLNFRSKMDRDKLIDGYIRLVQKIYSLENYYDRVNAFLEDYRPLTKGGRLPWINLVIFLKTLVLIGLFSPARRYYWPLLIRTVLTNPKALNEAIELTIMERHLRKMAIKLA